MTTPSNADQDPAPLVTCPPSQSDFGVNDRHFSRLVAERRIPYIKWGHLIRFDPAAIDEWLGEARHDLRSA